MNTEKTAYNFRQKNRVPTKKEEEDFIKNLKPSERTYSYKELKPPEELFKSGDWEGVAYNEKRGKLERFFLWLAERCAKNIKKSNDKKQRIGG